MPWPLPVVGFTSEIADSSSRCISKPDVFDLELLLQIICLAAKIGTDVASAVGLLLALCNQCLAVFFQPGEARKTVQFRRDPFVHRF